jgi:hypothetical protein
MPPPTDKKEAAIYHTILGEMHRMRGLLLNLQTLDDADTAAALRDHFGREQNVVMAKLREWRQRRPELYRLAQADFDTASRPPQD